MLLVVLVVFRWAGAVRARVGVLACGWLYMASEFGWGLLGWGATRVDAVHWAEAKTVPICCVVYVSTAEPIWGLWWKMAAYSDSGMCW